MQKHITTVVFFLMCCNAFAQTGTSGFNRLHISIEAAFLKNNIDDVLSETFARELYQGTTGILLNTIVIGGNPEDISGNSPAYNLNLDFSINTRLRIGIGINGIPEIHYAGYIDKDSLINNADNGSIVYDKVEELVKGITTKTQLIYVLKQYKEQSAFGWELNAGAGITCNFVSVKQKFLLQTTDSAMSQVIAGNFEEEQNKSSIGAFLSSRLDIHITKSVSVTSSVSWMFDTGIKIDETQFSFHDASQQLDAHELKFNGFLIGIGLGWHF